MLANTTLPIAPGTLVVVDHYAGLRAGAHVIICHNADHASREVEASLREIAHFRKRKATPDPGYDHSLTPLVAVESFYC